jgi:hypothetical protein
VRLETELADLLARFRAELAYNDAKGSSAYREGMHDGLHFAADALAEVLERNGLAAEGASEARAAEAELIPNEYGV